MIISFACKETEKIFGKIQSADFPPEIQKRAWKKLWEVNNAQVVEDLRNPPGNGLEMLSGDRAGEYSIRINRQFRICFVWIGGNAENVEIVDYH